MFDLDIRSPALGLVMIIEKISKEKINESMSLVNLFEKDLTMSKRAKSLYSLEESSLSSLKHKPTFQAILENNEGSLQIKNNFKENSTEEGNE